jgi:hypothetical protein
MSVTVRDFVAILHGMLFGGFFLFAAFGVTLLLLDWRDHPEDAGLPSRWRTVFLVSGVVLGWAAVLSGAYVVYPWYRAPVPAGGALELFPRALLLAHPETAGWHSLGMEWKEHVAWLAPMTLTTVVFIVLRYRELWRAHRGVRTAVLSFAAMAFVTAAIAGAWGALIDKAAPVRGGHTVLVMRSAR